jgi:class 3 adenylate cyclase/tetratricopeptide (TPR) repeat protein
MSEKDAIICPHCGASMPQSFLFCGRCGRALSVVEDAPAGERRQITVMFCDLVGSVPLSRLLDPEDFAAIVRRFQAAAVEVIEAHGGYVAQYLGDGILAYFGYPTADEHVAEQAVRAGLEIIGRIDVLSDDLMREHGMALSIRIGVHTGLVVVDEIGSGAHRERLALGETPNMAARLQSAAPTNALVVSRATHRLIETTFRSVDLGPQLMKGVDRPQQVYRVVEELHEDGIVDHLDVDVSSSTVGREADVERLLGDWAAATEGRGRAALILGEPGVGKSHLVQHVRARIGAAAHYGIVCRCAPNLESSAFHPVVDWLSRVLNFYPGQPADERLDMLRFVAEQNGLEEEDVVPLLGVLLTKASLDDMSALGYSPAKARARTEIVLETLILSMGADRPLLLLVEDVQWIDPSTRALLLRFADRIPTSPIYLLMTSRTVPSIDWPASCPLRRIELDRLNGDEIAEVIAEVAGHRRLPSPVIDRIREKADGVPLYAQEFTRMVLESGVLSEDENGFHLPEDMPELRIPSTLQDSLMARLDRLLPVKEVAQACSIFGRSFTIDLLHAATSTSRETLAAALDRLVSADLLVKESAAQCERYAFRHALLQEAAYESMLKPRRARYHRRVARYLIDHPGDSARTETIAFHLTRAGESEEAAVFWCRAGGEAQTRWENEEAVEYFSRGLALVDRLPDSDRQKRTAFHLNVGLAGAALQQKGYSHTEVAEAFERAAELASDLKDAAASIPAFLGLWSHYTVLADHAQAEVLAERLSKLAPLAPPSVNTFSAMASRASTWFWQGDIGSARRLIESLLVRFGDQRVGEAIGLTFQHPTVGVLSYLSLILWCQGRTQQAVQVGSEAIRTAEEFGHPFSLAFACGFNSVLHVYMGEVDVVRRMAGRTVELSDRYGFPFWHSVGSIIGAWADSESDEARAVDGMQRGLRALKEAGVRIWTAYPTALMAELMGRMGRPAEALDEFDAVLAECEEHGEYYFMPEIRRLRARLLDERGLGEQAVREREYALTMARRQTAGALIVRVLQDVLRSDSSSSPEVIELLRTELDALPADDTSRDLERARGMLTDATAARPTTTGRA